MFPRRALCLLVFTLAFPGVTMCPAAEYLSLEKALREPAKVKALDLSFNDLATLPAEIGKLTHLRELHLDNNRLTALPDALGDLRALEALFLSGNPLATIPAGLGKLTGLKVLVWENSRLSAEDRQRLQTLLPGAQIVFDAP